MTRAKAKSRTVFVVQPRLPFDDELGQPVGGDPERVFAIRAAAEKYVAERTRAARAFTNPFTAREPGELCKGGMRAFKAVLAKLKLKPPTKDGDGWGSPWQAWWDHTAATLTEAERDAVWDALTKFELYRVEETTLED